MATKKLVKPTKSSAAKAKLSKAGGGVSTATPSRSSKTPVKANVAAAALTPANSWLQDATLEIPVPPNHTFQPGSRELEFSVGMRQQDITKDLVRSELRGRALVHTEGQVLALAEASYVHVGTQSSLPEDLPQQLYGHLRPQLERLLALGGHTPPLPVSLDKIA